jgi:dipeptidyl aminopeptidase/acylaminoacyl peptidase
VIFDGKSNPEPLTLPSGPYRSPRVSRDGRWVAVENADAKSVFISVYEIDGRNTPRRLTFEGNGRGPLWSVDGQWVVFSADHDDSVALFRTRADGAGRPERLTTPDKGTTHYAQSWSRDGSQLVFSAETGADVMQSRLWLLSMEDRKTTPFGEMAAREATVSPDGRWIAYATRVATGTASSGSQVFVEPFPPTGAKYELPRRGGHPMWSPKGDALVTSIQALSHVTPVVTTPSFAFGPSVEVPRRGLVETNPFTGRRQSDMMPDGRIMGLMSPGGDGGLGSRDILVVLNWFDEVLQRVPRR